MRFTIVLSLAAILVSAPAWGKSVTITASDVAVVPEGDAGRLAVRFDLSSLAEAGAVVDDARLEWDHGRLDRPGRGHGKWRARYIGRRFRRLEFRPGGLRPDRQGMRRLRRHDTGPGVDERGRGEQRDLYRHVRIERERSPG
jgi:hypothetical protein